MCVTNTTLRRPALQPVSLRPSALISDDGKCPFEVYSDELPSTPFAMEEVFSSSSSASVAAPSKTTAAGGETKPRAKRRRKPQKPGLTAKNQERHFVVHDYHDHAVDSPTDVESDSSSSDQCCCRRGGGIAMSFPSKLHSVLDQIALDGYDHVISWQPHGRAFAIHQPKVFTEEIMPKYFRQSKLTSFQRQLNLYGFQRLTRGADAGAYYSELFLRGKPFLCQKMVRTKVKGTRYKAASSPEQEPNFYEMPPVLPDYKPQSGPRPGLVTPDPPSSPVKTGSTLSSQHQLPSGSKDYPSAKETAAVSSSETFVDDGIVPHECFEPIPWEPNRQQQQADPCLSDVDMHHVLDETFDTEGATVPVLSPEDVAFCSAWDPVVLDDLEIQAAMATDEELDEMIEMFLEG